ncbi:putative lipoprotein [Segatella baroniae F0067]|uniref:Putative lipoprotein n=2 Tax=Segatella baroniae TaxID=305719 RepID=U2P7A6_9BACT|nr:glycoside hydrolase family 18 [Segatella baroniae]ERK40021.1 putative lipoprotein [Segatella baroniae F0067]
MKKLYKKVLLTAGVILSMTACSDALDTEIKDPANLTVTNRSEAYYARLRDYKKSDHPVAMGWFGGWTGRSASLKSSLAGLPDSVDFVSLWGNWKNPTESQKEDLKFVQEKKGTKVLICWQIHDIGDQLTPEEPAGWKEKNPGKNFRHEFWGWGYEPEQQKKAVEKYARAILDTIAKYNYDGFDFDAEPYIPQIGFQPQEELWKAQGMMSYFIELLSKELGPRSGTGKLLVVDGMPEAIEAKMHDCFDYFILQVYHNSNSGYKDASSFQGRFDTQYQHYKNVMTPEQLCKKIIMTENFEDGANIESLRIKLAVGQQHRHDYDGLAAANMLRWVTTSTNINTGQVYQLPENEQYWGARSVIAYALWNPTINGVTYRKGGLGTFHMEYEYDKEGTINTYPCLRAAIQLQNPNNK